MVREFGFTVGGSTRYSEEKYELKNPFNGETVAIINRPTARDIDDAIGAAQWAFQATRVLPGYKKAEALLSIARGIRERREELARSITSESGKPIADARAEADRAAITFTIAAEESKRIGGEVIPLDIAPGSENRLGITRRFPIGPISGITPFNFPLNLVCHKVAPCIASGNSMVLKPASQTPMTSLLLGEIISEAGLPEGTLNILPCSARAAEPLISDPRIVLITFTGSAEVGWGIKARAGKKKVILELGGNAGVIIHSDADLDLAAARCTKGGFAYAGQICISVQRIFVQESIFEPFLSRFLPLVGKIKVGDPMSDDTEMGPMITLSDAERVEAWIKEAKEGGAKLLIGGNRSGALVEPTVLTATSPGMKVRCLEAFAPLVTVEPYATFEEAVAMVNDSAYGLQCGIFTRDLKGVFHAFNNLEVGGIIVNDVPTYRVDHMPYGGVKDSGLGREGLRYTIEEMTELRLLALNVG